MKRVSEANTEQKPAVSGNDKIISKETMAIADVVLHCARRAARLYPKPVSVKFFG
jgi:hypothetical protein